MHILEAENIDQVGLVSQSMGGYIYQVAALNYPDRVISLTTIEFSPIQPSYFSTINIWPLAITPTLLNLNPY